MAENTAIEWTDHTWNPWRGCTKISPGCAHCYAETLSHRNPGVLGKWGDEGMRVIASEAQWKLPLKWDRKAAKDGVRRKVFCASMADVFEDRDELVEPRERLFDLIAATPNLDWLLLTKRPQNWRKLLPIRKSGRGMFHIWAGVSVEDQKRADERIPWLLEIPALTRFLSVEPLLEPVDLSPWLFCDSCNDDRPPKRRGKRYVPSEHVPGVTWACRCECSRIDWVIIGGESGPKARPCHAEWIRSLIEQCKDAGVACFVKQVGSHCYTVPPSPSRPMGIRLITKNKKGGDPDEWPPDLRVREFPR